MCCSYSKEMRHYDTIKAKINVIVFCIFGILNVAAVNDVKRQIIFKTNYQNKRSGGGFIPCKRI